MRRIDQILSLLNKWRGKKSVGDIATALDTTTANINEPLQALVANLLVSREKIDRIYQYQITERGIAKASEPDFGKPVSRNNDVSAQAKVVSVQVPVISLKPGSMLTQRTQADGEEAPARFGVLTTGEMYIEANGKKLELTPRQSRSLVDFVCELPNKYFPPSGQKPTMASLPSRVHRMADD